MPHNNYNFNVSAGYALYDFGKTDLNIRQARENVLTQRHSLELTRQNLAYQIAQLYYGIGFLQKSIQAQDDVIATSAKLIEQTAVRYQNGDALEFDIVTQKVRLETAKTRKIDFENQVEKQKIMLVYLTGVSREDLTIAEFSTPDMTVTPTPIGRLVTQVAGTNKDILLAQDRIRSSETEIEIARKAHLPTLLLNVSAGIKNGYVPDISILRPNTAAGIAVTIPLYAGKRYDLQRKAAEISRQASDFNSKPSAPTSVRTWKPSWPTAAATKPDCKAYKRSSPRPTARPGHRRKPPRQRHHHRRRIGKCPNRHRGSPPWASQFAIPDFYELTGIAAVRGRGVLEVK